MYYGDRPLDLQQPQSLCVLFRPYLTPLEAGYDCDPWDIVGTAEVTSYFVDRGRRRWVFLAIKDGLEGSLGMIVVQTAAGLRRDVG